MQKVGLPGQGSAMRSPGSKFIPALVLFVLFLATSVAATQYLAAHFGYSPRLGEPLFARVYAPWQWLLWAQSFYDSAREVFNRVFVAAAGGLGLSFAAYAVFVVIVSRRLNAIKDLHGSAHWATRKEIESTGLLPKSGQKGSGVYVGAWHDDKAGVTRYLRHNGPEHVIALAPTRTGKGVGLIIPTLLSWPESAVVYDLKGENFALTAGYRKSVGQQIFAFDPTDTEGRGVGYNPLAEVRIRTDHEVADAQNIVQQIVDPDGKGLETHWDKTSFMFLVGAILYTLYSHTDHVASLTDVANVLSNEAGIDHLYARMKENQFGPNGTAHPVIAKAAIDMLEKDERERGSVLSTAKTFFALYTDPVVARNIARSGFRIADLMNAEKPCTLYIIVDPANKDRLKPLVRLVITQIVRNLMPRLKFSAGAPVKNYRHRLLLMLDEFPALGKLSIFEGALGYMAGYGLKAFLIAQDLTQLTSAYGQHESIISNCHVRVAFAPNKVETAKLLSEMTGTATIVKRQVSASGTRMASVLGQVSVSMQEFQRPLLTPDECMRLPAATKNADGLITAPGDMLVFVSGNAPIYGRQILYFNDPVFAERAAMPEPATSDSLT